MGKFDFLKGKSNSDLYSACAFVLDSAKVKYNKLNLQNLLEAHIEYPSLLSLKDVLAEYDVVSMAVRKGNHVYGAFAIRQGFCFILNFTKIRNKGNNNYDIQM